MVVVRAGQRWRDSGLVQHSQVKEERGIEGEREEAREIKKEVKESEKRVVGEREVEEWKKSEMAGPVAPRSVSGLSMC